jgi:hypothetical protein
MALIQNLKGKEHGKHHRSIEKGRVSSYGHPGNGKGIVGCLSGQSGSPRTSHKSEDEYHSDETRQEEMDSCCSQGTGTQDEEDVEDEEGRLSVLTNHSYFLGVIVEVHSIERRYMKSQKGQALLEFALVLPVFLLLILAGTDLIMTVNQKSNLDEIAWETARQVSLGNPCQATVIGLATAVGFPNPNSITATCLGNPIVVTLTYNTQPLFAGFFPVVTLQSKGAY